MLRKESSAKSRPYALFNSCNNRRLCYNLHYRLEAEELRFEVELSDRYLIWLDDHCAYRAMQGDTYTGLEDVNSQDVVNAMVLGAAKAGGFGKWRKRSV